jgi:N-acetyl-anhydromuramyl-L-alanine amidase AmpD
LNHYGGLVDGDFGGGTEKATKSFQTDQAMPVTGVVDELTINRAMVFGYSHLKKSLRDSVPLRFLQAKWFTWADRTSVDFLVIHTAEVLELASSAEAVASYFNTMGQDRRASAHFSVDCDSVVQSVDTRHVAYHCPGLNRTGIGYELCGRAAQTVAQWNDNYSNKMLDLVATIVAADAVDWAVPMRFVGAEELLQGVRGITTHVEGTRASVLANKQGLVDSPFYNKKNPKVPLTNHSDPGPNFPMDNFIIRVMSRVP